MVQWLRLHVLKARGPGSIPVQGTRAFMLQLKIPCGATKDTQNSDQRKTLFFFRRENRNILEIFISKNNFRKQNYCFLNSCNAYHFLLIGYLNVHTAFKLYVP